MEQNKQSLKVGIHSISDPDALMLKAQGKPILLYEEGNLVATLQANSAFFQECGAPIPERLEQTA